MVNSRPGYIRPAADNRPEVDSDRVVVDTWQLDVESLRL